MRNKGAARFPGRGGVAALMAGLTCLLVALSISPGQAQDAGAGTPPDQALPIRTDSPRETFATFQRLSAEMESALAAYIAEPSFAGVLRLALLSDQLNGLLDLEAEAASSRREVGIRTMTYLMDIFGRIPVIDPSGIPDSDRMEAEGQTALRIPGTPVYITRIAEGERQGEYLFAASSVDVAPRFFRAVQGLPLRTDLPIQSLTSLGPQLTGPLVPPRLVAAMPPTLRVLWLDTPAWKVLTTVLVVLLIALLVAATFRIVSRLMPESRLGRLVLQAMLPIAILIASGMVLPAVAFQINLSGQFADVLNAVQTLLTYGAWAWLFWVSVRLAFEAVILSPRIPDTSLDANLLRLVANVLGAIGVVVILAFGGQSIGIPILSILAGLGIGGLAMALALRPTLENLVGGVILYLDRPVRVGDFCRFADQIGTIEAIGLRSTKLRAPDRTLITVPNAQFADMQIVNFAHCDQMLIKDAICLRYETTPDQVRYLLAQLRLMLHAHPRIDSDTIRVRFAGFGTSALNIDMRVYVQTREWNDFFAVREDVYLRIADLVADAGTGFAFPSQTIYIGRDPGLDDRRADAAASVVQGWRDAGNLPFPTLPEADLARIDGSLDYPPRGSHALRVDSSVPETTPETLSAEPHTEDPATRKER